MSAERPSPERTTGQIAVLAQTIREALLTSELVHPGVIRMLDVDPKMLAARKALDELVAALAAETRLRIADAARAAKEKNRADALAARLEQAQAALQEIADDSKWVPDIRRARAALAALQETPPRTTTVTFEGQPAQTVSAHGAPSEPGDGGRAAVRDHADALRYLRDDAVQEAPPNEETT